MAVGRKQTPTNVRVLMGDKHKDRYNLNEPVPEGPLGEDIPVSVTGNEYALEMWTYLAPKLVRMGIAADVDRFAFEALCVTYGLWRFKPDPRLTTKLQSLLSEFGLTPSSRTRLVGNLPHEQDDAMERLLKQA